MEQALSVGREFLPSNEVGDPLDNPMTVVRVSAVHQVLNLKVLSLYNLCIVLILSTNYFGLISAQSNFTVSSTSYNCSTNMICWGDAHSYTGNQSIGIQHGRLSLIQEVNPRNYGRAYHNQPVQLKDPLTEKSFSFNTSFVVDSVWDVLKVTPPGTAGDGIAFVISAVNNFTDAAGGGAFGFFEHGGKTPFKSIVVEFDTYQNNWDFTAANDISDNHVSLDFSTVAYAAAVNASDINVNLGANITKYVWVEYSEQTGQFEVRVSNKNSRPINPLLNYLVDLSDYVEDYMWVGFAGAAGDKTSYNYIGDWTFSSYVSAIRPAPVPVPNSSKSFLYLSLVVGLSLLACIFLAVFVRRSYRDWMVRWKAFREERSIVPREGMPERFTYKQLSIATKTFSEESKLGQGGFGNVYRGVLPVSGIPVAVKRISRNSKQGEKEFMAEISIISRLRHRNLIQLFGWCKDAVKEEYLLVYELMPNGSLDKALFVPDDNKSTCLSWPQRLNIVTGLASALDYLHQGWNQKVIHRDIKSSNIMLDEKWNAKLGDFGLARLVDHQREVATTLAVGTYGYIAPEVAAYGKFTDKSDIFAFGAVVLEIACGRKALSSHVPEDEELLVDWVWQRRNEGNLLSTVDRHLEVYDTCAMERLLIIGLMCSHPNPRDRPSMRHVVQVLAGEAPIPSMPAAKPDFSFHRQSFPTDHLNTFIYERACKSNSNSSNFVTPGGQLVTSTNEVTTNYLSR